MALPDNRSPGDQHPFHTVINEFRLRHLEALPELFVQVLKLCDRAGLVKLEHVSLDGSKVKANASKHKAMSHARMESEVERLEGEIHDLLAKAAAIDQELNEKKYIVPGLGDAGDRLFGTSHQERGHG